MQMIAVQNLASYLKLLQRSHFVLMLLVAFRGTHVILKTLNFTCDKFVILSLGLAHLNCMQLADSSLTNPL